MKKLTLLLTITFYALFIPKYLLAQNPILLDDNYFSLKRIDSQIIIKNSTNDTLKLLGELWNYLPINRTDFNRFINPSTQDTLKCNLAYPDFAIFESPELRIYVVPGKTIICNIVSIKPLKVAFSGDFERQNEYYFAFDKYFNDLYQESQPYYKAGNKLPDFNKFPVLADSINQLHLNFLKNYNKPLPEWFREHEYWRLTYNCAFRKYHVPFDKQFGQGEINDLPSSYFDFEKKLNTVIPKMIINTEYLWYQLFKTRNAVVKTKSTITNISLNMLNSVDRLYKNSDLNDILKVRLLSDIFQESKPLYDSLMRTITFKNPENKVITDSLIKNFYAKPSNGEIAPNFSMINLRNEKVQLHSFSGKTILLNFWATWCKPCILELPFENKLAEKFKSRNAVIINVCIESDKENWVKFSKSHTINTINLFVNKDEFTRIKKQYDFESYPRSVLINAELKVISNNYKKASQIDNNDLETYFR